MKEYLLFDLDGTLTDSGEGITKSVQYALQGFGIEEPDLRKLECFVGPPLRDSFRKYYGFDEKTAEEAVKKYRERYAQLGIFENTPYEGIPKMLKSLKKNGFRLAVASSKPQEYVEKVLVHFEIRQYFQVVVGGTMDGKGDQKKDIIEKVLKEFFKDSPPEKEKVYMIGDTAFDIEGAKQTGVESVGVTYGFGKLEDLTFAQADFIVHSVWELWDFLLREVRAKETKESLWKQAPAVLFWIVLFLTVRELTAVFLGRITERFFTEAGWAEDKNVICRAVSYLFAGCSIIPAAKKYIRSGQIDRRLQYLMVQPMAVYGLAVITGVLLAWGLQLLFALTGFTESSESFRNAKAVWINASLPVGFFCFGIVTPLAEELLFRGILYNYLRRLFKARSAVILSGVLFGVYHGNPVQGIYAFLMGLFLAYAYEYFGEFKVPVILHMLFNLLALGMEFLKPQRGALSVACAGSLVMAVFGLLMLHRRKNIL